MRNLIDTNVLLEIILNQPRAEECKSLLSTNAENDFSLTDFSLHSIGLSLFRQKRQDAFSVFLKDMFVEAGLNIVALSEEDMDLVVQHSRKFNLDFDDAYQYVTPERHDLVIVSFDRDFDHTERGRKTPADVLAQSQSTSSNN